MSQVDQKLDSLEESMLLFTGTINRLRVWQDIKKRSRVEIDRPAALLLYFLMQDSSCHLRNLAERIGVEAPSVTRKVQQLEHDGFIKRVVDPKDRRMARLNVTIKGKKVLDKIHKCRAEVLAEIVSQWSPQDKVTFSRLFMRLSQDTAKYYKFTDITKKEV